MHNIQLVAKREYLEQVRGKAFRLSTILVPVIIAVVVGAFYLANRSTGGNKHLAIAAQNPALVNEIAEQLKQDKATKIVVDVYAPATANDRSQLIQQVTEKKIDGFFWIDSTEGGKVTATYEAQSAGDIGITEVLKSALNHALIRERLALKGVKDNEADTILANVEVETRQIDKQGNEVKGNATLSFLKGYFMAFLLIMTTMVYGLNVARSIIQEKTSRIFEVMLSTAKAGDLLAGKLIGVGAVGLTQLAIWALMGAALVTFGMAGPLLSGEINLHISWYELLIFGIYFILGYLLFSAFFSGLAATCETEQELQMFTPVAVVVIYLSLALIPVIIRDSNSWISIIASCFPPTASIIMMLRIGIAPVPIVQVIISIALLIFAIWGVLWFSTRLYRVGILMYGKRATLPEILRWIRYS
jgi:ABC-2 type transport system permease protein